MHLLRLTCSPEDAERLVAELWEAGTGGIQEIEDGESVILLAAFEDARAHDTLLDRFRLHLPDWQNVPAINWVEANRSAWPSRSVGERLFLAPVWNQVRRLQDECESFTILA